MLPLNLLRSALQQPILIELKTGETYNGRLTAIDQYMNLFLQDVIQTSRDGQDFHSIKEVYIRGQQIKYLRVADEVLSKLNEEQANQAEDRAGGGGDRGGRGRGRGRGDGRGRGRGGGGQGGFQQQRDGEGGQQQQSRGGHRGGRGGERGRGRGNSQPRGGG